MVATSALAVTGPAHPLTSAVLTPDALALLEGVERAFGERRRQLMTERDERQQRLNAGERPDFLPYTSHIRNSEWRVPPAPDDLVDRRVEITGPVERKMIINALNSGAKVFMADFEDSNTPTWANQLEGQQNLADAVRRSITYASPEGKPYQLNPTVATLVVRPRGWHLVEKHVTLDGQPMSGSLFDATLYLYHNAHELLRRGSGPYFYLPKLESHREAALWHDVFEFLEERLQLPRGSIRVTVLIETILAAFEMDEILHALGPYALGLNCGRWDYIFSYIKKMHRQSGHVLPDRSQVTMTTHFLRSYSRLAIQTCHRRGAYAIGGMSAYIPVKADAEANARALEAVRADKLREVTDGHDGTWVAHPGLVPIAKEVFDTHMPGPHNLAKTQADLRVTADDLLRAPEGTITHTGLRTNLEVGLRYLESWLRGVGCVPIHNLMEDAATAEISRAQVWQWLHTPGCTLSDGRPITPALVDETFAEVKASLAAELGPAYTNGRYDEAAQLYHELLRAPQMPDFLTPAAYQRID